MTDTQINRWSPYAVDGGCDAYGEMEEDEVGDWVNYEDHTAHIDAQDAKIKALVEALVRIEDLTSHNMPMSAKDEQCVNREARAALVAAKETI